MTNEINRKIEKIKSIPPNEKNEPVIRSACHRLLNNIFEAGGDYKLMQKAKKECYAILNNLEETLLLSGEKGRYTPFFKYDFPLIVKNAVCVCDIMLSPPFLSFDSGAYSPFFAVCSEKLITRAVCAAAMYFFKYYKTGTVTFSASKRNLYTVLSAKIERINQCIPVGDKKIFAVLEKIADIHNGRFLIKLTKNSFSFCLAIKNQNEDEARPRKTQSYLDMLYDKTSQAYIILSSDALLL